MRRLFFILFFIPFSIHARDSALLGKAAAFQEKNQIDSAKYYYDLSIREDLRLGFDSSAIKTCFEFGDYIYYKGKIDVAVEYYFKALEIGRARKMYKTQLKALRFLGWSYWTLGKDDKAILYYNQGLTLAREIHNNVELGFYHSYLFNFYNENKRMDSAVVHLDSLDHYAQLTNNKTLLFLSLTGRGVVYEQQKKYKESLEMFLKSRQTGFLGGTSPENYDELARYYDKVATSYSYQGMNKQALLYYDSTLAIAEKENDYSELVFVYMNMADMYSDSADFKNAEKFLRKYISASDTMYTRDNNQKMAEMQAKYDVATNAQKIILLNEEKEADRQRMNFIIGVSILGFVLLLISIFAFVNTKRKNRILRIQKTEIENKTEMLNKQAAEIARFRTQMNPHFIFNVVNSLQRFVLKGEKEKTLGYLADFSGLMRKTLNNSDKELILLSDELSFLEKYVMFEQLRFENQFTFKINIEEKIDPENVVLPPMIIQPFIENSIRHGLLGKNGKGEIVLSFSQSENNTLKISIRDNGIGRDAAAKQNEVSDKIHESKGMSITANRIAQICKAHELTGEKFLSVNDVVGENGKIFGTEVIITLPFIETF